MIKKQRGNKSLNIAFFYACKRIDHYITQKVDLAGLGIGNYNEPERIGTKLDIHESNMKIFIKNWLFLPPYMTKAKIKELIDKKHIKWIQVHFTDLLGGLRVLHIPANRFLADDILSKGINFDGSSIGFRRVEKSDMIALPDQETFKPIPYEKDEAMIRANLYDTEYNPYRAGPRNILKKAIGTAKKNGYDKVMISPEMEFCCFKKSIDEDNDLKESISYFSPPPLDDLKEYRKKLSDVLMESGYQVKYHHHEKGKFQHEIEVKGLEALVAADFCSYFKFVAREIASSFDINITFMPVLPVNSFFLLFLMHAIPHYKSA